MEIEKITRLWFEEMWSKPNLKVADDIVSASYKPNWIQMEQIGPDLVKHEINYFRSIFPDLVYKIKDGCVDGNKAWVWYSASGTNRGKGWGIEPTGKNVSFEGAAILFFNANNQVQDLWESYSLYDIFESCGAVPPFWDISKYLK